ncbi:MAG TPA: FG-GAP repeat protein [Acidimicrobiales bacterium]|nr:FG-GAP repeat protein [Acidimicrobiales bacterium]
MVAVVLLAAIGGPAGAAGAAGAAGSGTDRTGGAAAPAAPEAPTVRADFNGDGAEDLAVGAPFETVGSVADAGTVNVLYGGGGGLTGTGSQLFNQESAGVASDAETGDVFGLTLATGDFDGDGFTDLAVGSRGESVGSVESAGTVTVLYGSATGLQAVGSQLFTQDSPGVGSTAEAFDGFGASLAAGDFDQDGNEDLAVGADFETVGDRSGAGAATVLYGADGTGLTGVGSTLLTQGGPDVHSEPEPDDQFGAALSVGDYDGDGDADLAVGAPGEASGPFDFAGAVNVFDGSAGGVTVVDSLIFTQNVPGVGSEAEPFDAFGATLASGDFDGNGFADLAVGVPSESVGAVDGAGAVNTLPGTATGLTGTGSQLLTQDVGDLGSTAESFDSFGSALSAGDFDNDDVADLAVGVPFESVGAIESAGAVNVLDGSAVGLAITGTKLFVQGSGGVGSTPEFPDEFGEALAAADFDGDGDTDLAVGAPFESVGSIEQAGAVNVLNGSGAGLTGAGGRVLHQDVPGVGSDAEVFDAFGFTLSATRPSPAA